MPEPSSQPHKPVVLCVDDDRDIAEVVEAILVDGGYDVSCLYTLDDDALRRTVGRLEPDCVLLDGLPGPEYGSWESAAWLEHRARSVPVVMFTAHQPDSREAQEAHTDRARRADFAAVLLKPLTSTNCSTRLPRPSDARSCSGVAWRQSRCEPRHWSMRSRRAEPRTSGRRRPENRPAFAMPPATSGTSTGGSCVGSTSWADMPTTEPWRWRASSQNWKPRLRSPCRAERVAVGLTAEAY